MAEASSPSASSTPSTVFTGTDAAGGHDDAAEHAGVFGVDLDDGLLGLDFGQRVADGDRVAFLLEPLVQIAARGVGGHGGKLDEVCHVDVLFSGGGRVGLEVGSIGGGSSYSTSSSTLPSGSRKNASQVPGRTSIGAGALSNVTPRACSWRTTPGRSCTMKVR